MKIEAVDLFYLSMPVVRDIADGSQDALLVRVRSGGFTGWGECEASPLVSIANYCCPMSHQICKCVRDTVLGQSIESPQDILDLGDRVRIAGLDIAQTDHTFSGIEIALWDLLGKKLDLPVYRLLGYHKAYPKLPYASQLFGDTPEETYAKAKSSRLAGYRAAKFGWGPYGHGTAEIDGDHVHAARSGLGDDGVLMVDAGTVWIDDVSKAKLRLASLIEQKVLWLEEPFLGGALNSYAQLAALSSTVKLAGGEGAHNFYMARHLIDHGKIGFVQIDTGRIGGIGPAKRVADLARSKGVTYVNHTFTTHLALSASLQPFAGREQDQICEYPVAPTQMAIELSSLELQPGHDGLVRIPESPGLGAEPKAQAIQKYLVDVEIKVRGTVLYRTPQL